MFKVTFAFISGRQDSVDEKRLFAGMRLANIISIGFVSAILAVFIPGRVQCQSDQVDTIWLGNPSFEDIPRRGGGTGFDLPIRGWL